MDVKLRTYQQEGVDQTRQAFMLGHRAVLYVLPTGGGKTVIFCHIAEQAATKGNRICVLVHRQELVDQTSRSLTSLGVQHGIIAAGTPMELEHPVQVASVQTLVRRLDRIPDNHFSLLVVDEAHHAIAGSWSKVIEHYSKARVLGVTATPERLDGRGLIDKFTAMVVGPQMEQLQGMGYLAQCRIFAPPMELDLSKVAWKMGDYDMRQVEEQTMRPDFVGDAVGHFKKYIQGGTAIAFCTSINHSKTIAEAFNDAGITAAHLDGDMKKDERRDLIKKLGTGEVKLLTSCQIISEGTDVPSVTGCLLLRPTQSLSLYLQQVGRCLRPAPGKEAAIILDHVGNVERHGLPNTPRAWSLHAPKRSKRDTVEEVSVKVCPECFSVVASAAQTCSSCGHSFQTTLRKHRYSPEELIELTPDHILERQEKRQKRMEVAEARTLEDLQALGAARGYKPGWAHYIFNSRQHRRYGTQQ